MLKLHTLCALRCKENKRGGQPAVFCASRNRDKLQINEKIIATNQIYKKIGKNI